MEYRPNILHLKIHREKNCSNGQKYRCQENHCIFHMILLYLNTYIDCKHGKGAVNFLNYCMLDYAEGISFWVIISTWSSPNIKHFWGAGRIMWRIAYLDLKQATDMNYQQRVQAFPLVLIRWLLNLHRSSKFLALTEIYQGNVSDKIDPRKDEERIESQISPDYWEKFKISKNKVAWSK